MSFKSRGYPISKQKRAFVSPRHASFSALLDYEKTGKRLDKSLKEWKKSSKPKDIDYQLAQEITYGVVKRKLTIDHYAKQIEGISKLKLREKIILRMALYQLYFMDKIPFYAIVDESVTLAKKVISLKTGAFFNALIRKLDPKVFKVVPSKDIEIQYSYPKYFVELLSHQFDVKQAADILKAMNIAPYTFVKKRNKINSLKLKKEDADIVYEKGFTLYKLKNLKLIETLKDDPDYYFQSLTQTKLIDSLALKVKEPASIIDLCASPGGKLLAAFDLYPNAPLYANDVSPARLEVLKENIAKYGLDVQLSCEPAEKLNPERKFDLVIVDAPCTNSGVLNRRAEARWKITKDHLHGLCRLQKEILKNAVNLMDENGRIWYLTCSILSEENEKVIEEVCQKYSLQVDGKLHKILPDVIGYDGGFSCVLKKI